MQIAKKKCIYKKNPTSSQTISRMRLAGKSVVSCRSNTIEAATRGRFGQIHKGIDGDKVCQTIKFGRVARNPILTPPERGYSFSSRVAARFLMRWGCAPPSSSSSSTTTTLGAPLKILISSHSETWNTRRGRVIDAVPLLLVLASFQWQGMKRGRGIRLVVEISGWVSRWAGVIHGNGKLKRGGCIYIYK